jgi:NADH-quinone oxidoreductase subunit H
VSPLLVEFLLTLLKVVVITQVLLGLFAFMTYAERRLLAFMQFRLGPNRVGPWGLLQPVADGIKLFFKEELMPASASAWAFFAAPVVAVTAAFLAIATVPYGPPLRLPGTSVEVTPQIADLDIGLLFIFAVTALGVYSVVLAGWSANSKYSLLGGLRSSAQMFSYELSLGMSFVGVIMLAESFRISDIVESQAGWFWNWNLSPTRQFLAGVVYFISASAEVSRTPFDLPEGETDLVAGYHTEYSSMKFAMMQMAEYLNIITVSVLTTNLFLGGWHPGLPFLPSGGLWGLVYFAVKVFGVLFVFIWMRGTLPRFRYDQLMHFGWKVLIPLAALNILGTATWVAVLGR